MISTAANPTEYLSHLPEERQQVMEDLRNVILDNLPEGFEEAMSYGMLGYVVPHSRYPDGYHCDPKQPLPFISLASQKNFVAIYHMGLYADPELLNWFTTEYGKHSKTKLDMGKSCIRFKKMDQIPLQLIGELAAKVTPAQWIARYESQYKKSGK
jgi:Domain of unknown function (DU1801)